MGLVSPALPSTPLRPCAPASLRRLASPTDRKPRVLCASMWTPTQSTAPVPPVPGIWGHDLPAEFRGTTAAGLAQGPAVGLLEGPARDGRGVHGLSVGLR